MVKVKKLITFFLTVVILFLSFSFANATALDDGGGSTGGGGEDNGRGEPPLKNE
jgi:hypothetical protein